MIYSSLVFKNGQVVTVSAKNDVASSLAVYDDKIVYVGDDDGADSFIGEGTRVIDLQGKSLLPGFIDSHAHQGSIAITKEWISCKPKYVKSIEDIKKKIKEYAERLPKGSVIRGFNYNPAELEEKRHPTRWDFDEVAPDHIVMFVHASFHFSVYNSLALGIAGINADTPDPPGGEYGRDFGVLNGLASENAHWDLYGVFQPTLEELMGWLLNAQDYMLQRGITSVHDAGDSETFLDAIIELHRQKKWKVRTNLLLFSNYGNDKFLKKFLDIGIHTGLGDSTLRLGPFKVMLDGSSIGGTCALREPYTSDPSSTGMLTMSQEELNETMLRAHKNNYQLACHCIGDKAVEMVLDAYENALRIKPKKDHRFRIEHCSIVDAGLIKRIQELGIIPVAQPEFLYSAGDVYRKLYGDRADMMFPLRAFLDAGLRPALSTDCPVVDEDPLLVLRSACKRQSTGGDYLGRDQAVTLMDAIRMYTYNGAYASFEEDVKGSLEVGKLADMIVLSKPILDTEIDDLCSIELETTILGGEIVYSK